MSDWQGIGTPIGPITPGDDAAITMAYPLVRTWLSIDRYARVMGIAPMPFNSATATNSDGDFVFTGGGSCNEFWYQHDWQDHDRVSREQLAITIKQCEDELMEAVGYPLAPTWIVEEAHRYPRHHRRDGFASPYDIRGAHKSIVLNYGKVIAGGRRAVTRQGSAAVSPTYIDQDGDGFAETARVSVATTETDANGIKVYFKDMNGDPEWEIRPCRTKAISSGTFTADFYTWQFIDPDVREAFPVSDNSVDPIDIGGDPPTNVVAEVDVYLEYNDNTDNASQFLWAASPELSSGWNCTICGGSGCAACGLTGQYGCLDVMEAESGLVAPWPATYDDDESSWDIASWSVCREPEMVKFWYFAGDYNQTYLKDREFDSLSRDWQRVIARMATARLERPLCTCGQIAALVDYLRTDMAITDGSSSKTISFAMMDNPFGTRVGEIEAWRYVSQLTEKNLRGFAI